MKLLTRGSVGLSKAPRIKSYQCLPTWQRLVIRMGLNENSGSALPLTSRPRSQFYCKKATQVDDISTSTLATASLTLDLINHLERTSLVEFGSEEAFTRLTEAIEFANVLWEVDTRGVEPMVSVLENSSLRLRPDTVEVTNRDGIMKNAVLTEDDFFVSPPGNIPLSSNSSANYTKIRTAENVNN